FIGQRTEGNKLAPAPVNAAFDGSLGAVLSNLAHSLVVFKAFRSIQVRLAKCTDFISRNRGIEAASQRLRSSNAFLLLRPLLLSFLDFSEYRLHLVAEVASSSFCVFCGEVATTDEVFGVRLANTAVVFDLVVEDWLGHRWVIRLVVTAEAVANQVDEDILAEATTVLGSQLTYPDNSFWVVAIDVEDRTVKALG